MQLKVEVNPIAAEAEVNAYLDTKNIYPKQREGLTTAIEHVVEAMTYGNVSIKEDGTIVQKLIVPIGSLNELTYAARIEAHVINARLSKEKNDNQGTRNMVYITSYTGQLVATINKLEPADRNTAEAIAFFFQF